MGSAILFHVMFLQKLELQGFKTFAKKTTLSFPGPKGSVHALTGVVGPNGSGKSNLADAIRWALGEQSLKLLRGKEAEDVIFAGGDGKARAGFAEVSLTFNNEDKAMPVEFSEVTITRRLYRDGTSEYLVNNTGARLQDIQLMLAEGNVGQRSYSVVGQGMVDHILISSPEERKAFFDDATGVKPFQIKRHQAVLKLKRTYENLEQVETILREIEPRLRSLKRQVNRLAEREAVEQELRAMQWKYYGALWNDLARHEVSVRSAFSALDAQVQTARGAMTEMENKLESIAKAEVGDGAAEKLQNQYRALQRELTALRDEEFQIQKDIELAKVRVQSSWAPLPLPSIIDEIKALLIEKDLGKLHDLAKSLLKKLERPAPEAIKADPKLVGKLEESRKEIGKKEKEMHDLDAEIERAAHASRQERTELFEIQKELRAKQSVLHDLEQKRNGLQIELARFEERRSALSREIDEELKDQSVALKSAKDLKSEGSADQLYPEIQKVKYKLELIGGIDPEAIKEFEETSLRFDFLDGQIKDLRTGIRDTEKVIDELDEKIRKQSEKQFKAIDKEFQRYFKILFGGGSCALVQMTHEDVATTEPKSEDAHIALDHASTETGESVRRTEDDDTLDAIKARVGRREDAIVGIEIQATPPGKKLKALNLLSGGERALTSIALLSAIMATNPSPFVVLDEVDAALDEANTVRFAAILDDLRKLTQFIVVTHNRATMERADLIYGVTMGDDGISKLLSVNLEEIADSATARR